MWIRVSFVIMLAILWGMVVMLGVSAQLAVVLSAGVLGGAFLRHVRARAVTRLAGHDLSLTFASESNVPATHPQQRFLAVLQDLHDRAGMQAPLAELPLYVGLGASHDGLETALAHADVTWLARELPDIAGCTWSLARECAVLRPRDAASARRALGALYRHRRAAPVNGFLVALSLEDLLDKTPTALWTQAQALRHEIDVYQDVLHCRAPVYLIITKCDRLAGFLDTFGTLPTAARRHLLGRVAGDDVRGAPVEWLSSQLDAMVQHLAQETLAMMQHHSDVAARERIYQYPEKLSGLRTPLLTWANAFFASSRRRTMPMLQGVFFVAVTQGGYVHDCLAGGKYVRISAPMTPPTPYFTHGLLRMGILPDCAEPTAVGAGRQARLTRQVGMAAAALLITLPALAYVQSAYYLAGSRAVVAEIARDLSANDGHLASLTTLEHTREQLGALDAAAARTSWLNAQSGMGQSAPLRDALRTLYFRTLRDAVLQPMLGYDAQQMMGFARRYAHDEQMPTDREFKLFFDKLRLHLLLTGAYDAQEHTMDERDIRWLAETLSRRWSKSLEEEFDFAGQKLLKQHVMLYLQALQSNPDMRLARDVEAIEMTRQVLSRADPAAALLTQVTAGAEAYSLNLTEILGDTSAPLYSEEVVPGGYTRSGWESGVRDRLEELALHNNNWVLGSPAAIRMAPYMQDGGLTVLEAAYWQRYMQVWSNFVASVHPVPPRSSEQAAAMLQRLQTDSEPALSRLRDAVDYNMSPLRPDLDADSPASRLLIPLDVQVMAEQITSLQALREALAIVSGAVITPVPAGHDAQSMIGRTP